MYRTNLTRFGYACATVSIGLATWPDPLHHDATWILEQTVLESLLTAVSRLALLGLRYPTKMLPVLILDSAWRLLWLGAVALPAALVSDLQPTMHAILLTSAPVVVALAVPWSFTRQQYWTIKADPWR